MHPLLAEYLKKQNLTVEEMDDDERKDLEAWRSILEGKEMTVDNIVVFIQAQLNLIDKLLRDLDNKPLKNERLLMQQVIYKTILNMIQSPNKEKEALEARLTALLYR